MLCGGHAGRAHYNTLEGYIIWKEPRKRFVDTHVGKYPSIATAKCNCYGTNHKSGCGCLHKDFILRARNNFSFILKTSQSAEDFSNRLRALPRHVCDQHEWEVITEKGECRIESCGFHPLQVCSCGECPNIHDFECEGKGYSTCYKFTCPLHSLLYEIDCNTRADMADQLIHPILGRGHSNLLEASHNILTRFRPKDAPLERAHMKFPQTLVCCRQT